MSPPPQPVWFGHTTPVHATGIHADRHSSLSQPWLEDSTQVYSRVRLPALSYIHTMLPAARLPRWTPTTSIYCRCKRCRLQHGCRKTKNKLFSPIRLEPRNLVALKLDVITASTVGTVIVKFLSGGSILQPLIMHTGGGGGKLHPQYTSPPHLAAGCLVIACAFHIPFKPALKNNQVSTRRSLLHLTA